VTTTDTRYPEERARDAFREAVNAGAPPVELARLYGSWQTAADVAERAEQARQSDHHQAWRARSEQWSRLWNDACVLGWRRDDGLRQRNLTDHEWRGQEPMRQEWLRRAAAYLAVDAVERVDGDLLGAPPQPGPPPPRRHPVQPRDYQAELLAAANGA
jgi:hypothetical protein